jgi:uncharacterized protein (TIGR02246 family)
MTQDEQQIRALVQQWINATKAGDTRTVLSLMTEDAVFLIPGRSPMTKTEFAAAATPPPGGVRPRIDGVSQIEELQLIGDWAYLRTKLVVTVHPPGAEKPIIRAGNTLTILRKENGKWLLARDANLLVTVNDPATFS